MKGKSVVPLFILLHRSRSWNDLKILEKPVKLIQ
jgi:hypothetical protein